MFPFLKNGKSLRIPARFKKNAPFKSLEKNQKPFPVLTSFWIIDVMSLAIRMWITNGLYLAFIDLDVLLYNMPVVSYNPFSSNNNNSLSFLFLFLTLTVSLFCFLFFVFFFYFFLFKGKRCLPGPLTGHVIYISW